MTEYIKSYELKFQVQPSFSITKSLYSKIKRGNKNWSVLSTETSYVSKRFLKVSHGVFLYKVSVYIQCVLVVSLKKCVEYISLLIKHLQSQHWAAILNPALFISSYL